ncbi:hypothetical protein E1B28_011908 [Marasmius oreades]|uniref:Uncharacterized protein n=1 Tax=Marasmius oreades TaxID=181124 RepID=A0A9P7RVS6_9AGAR|nr:uncharacterized protein E1B28_011908 [Marasmius oreades]KAG7090310.1 hypothetical protein E1B28_011908 [Marasmius oreades]
MSMPITTNANATGILNMYLELGLKTLRDAILEYFDFNDEDKQALSGNFIYQNYQEVLERLEEDLPLFKEMCVKNLDCHEPPVKHS